MRKSIALILGTGLAIALMFFSGSRFIDLVQRALPANQQLMGYFGLAGFEGGLLVWILLFRYGARGHWQRAISALMVVLCLGGIGYATYTDLKLGAGANGVIAAPDKGMVDLAITAIAIIIIANIAATVGVHLTDPEALHAAAEEEAKSNITAETLKHINANSQSLAAELAPPLLRGGCTICGRNISVCLPHRAIRRILSSRPSCRLLPHRGAWRQSRIRTPMKGRSSLPHRAGL